MGKIKVSVIIPVYNVEKYLRNCLDSVINQTLKEIEIICINDGSTDNSLNILLEYSCKYNNIKVINQKNKGLSITRNVGLSVAKGEYIYFLDSDDLIKQDLCYECYNVCNSRDLDILTFDAETFYDDNINEYNNNYYSRKKKLKQGVYRGEDFYIDLITKRLYRSSVCLCFYRRLFLVNNSLFFREGILHEDELFTNICIIKSKKISYIPMKFFKRRIRSNSIMKSNFGFTNAKSYLVVAEELYSFYLDNKLDINEKTRAVLLKRISRYYAVSYSIVKYSNNKDDIELKKYILDKFKSNKEVYSNRNIVDEIIIHIPKTFNLLKKIVYTIKI